MLLVKKYPNRRLYDTRSSRYITLDDLEKTIRGGEDVMVQDAQDGRDLTQEILTQIILDRGGGRILPSALLLRLIRLDDAALGEFLTRYVSWALDMYVQAKDRARALLPLNPLATAPFAATDALARLVLGATQWGKPDAPPVSGGHPEPPIDAAPPPEEVLGGPLPETPPPPAPREASAALPQPHQSPSAADLGGEMARLRREIEALKASLVPAAAPRSSGKKTSKKRAAKRA